MDGVVSTQYWVMVGSWEQHLTDWNKLTVQMMIAPKYRIDLFDLTRQHQLYPI
jgi:hypothetical protein